MSPDTSVTYVPGRSVLQADSEWRSFAAPLLLTRHTVVIAVHLHPRTVPQEISRLSARSHLRAVCSAVALELRRSLYVLLVGSATDLRNGFSAKRRGLCVPRVVGTVPLPHGDCCKSKNDEAFHGALILEEP